MFRISRTQLAHFALPIALIVPATASAELSQTPLYLTTSVKPNIFFLVDDSGSMDCRDTALHRSRSYLYLRWLPDQRVTWILPLLQIDRDEILESCAGYNVLYLRSQQNLFRHGMGWMKTATPMSINL